MTSGRVRRGFFSFDAALSLLAASLAFLLFSVLFQHAAFHTQSQSLDQSGRLLALRFSSLVLHESQERGEGSYAQNRIDLERLRSLDLPGMLAMAGKSHAKVSLSCPGGESAFEREYGERGSEAFCVIRLAELGGRPARLEVCIS